MSLVLAPKSASRQIGLSGQLQTRKQGLVHAKGAAHLFWVEAVVAGTLVDVLVDSGSSGCLISGRLANSLGLIQAPCKDPVESGVVGVNVQSFCPIGEVKLFAGDWGCVLNGDSASCPQLASTFHTRGRLPLEAQVSSRLL